MTVAQNDSLVGPLSHQLALVAQQIEDIGTIYEKVPEAAPEDNSVMFPCRKIVVTSGTNGRLDLVFEFDIVHCFRRVRLQDDLARCYAAMPAWATVLGSYANIRLGGEGNLTDLTGIDIEQIVHGGQTMLAVISHIKVLREFPIPTS